MKSVGERIRQARNAKLLSGEALAGLVGYKRQSAISNLENRAGGSGGNKLAVIAHALGVPVLWLLSGPDSDTVPFLDKAKPTQTLGELGFDASTLETERAATLRYAYRAGVVQGGDGGFIEDFQAEPTAQEPEPVPYASTRLDEQAYAVKVRGSSMEPTIMAGWDVVASPSRPGEPPDLCVVYFADNRKALKRLLWRRDGMVCLESISAGYEKITESAANIVRMDKVISIVPN